MNDIEKKEKLRRIQTQLRTIRNMSEEVSYILNQFDTIEEYKSTIACLDQIESLSENIRHHLKKIIDS